MTRVQTKVYEYKLFPLPDPRTLTVEERNRIETAFDDLMMREDELDEDATIEKKEAQRDALDRAVLSSIDMEDRFDELKEAVRSLVEMREQGAGKHTQVLVERAKKREVVDLAGVSEARESMTLGDFE